MLKLGIRSIPFSESHIHKKILTKVLGHTAPPVKYQSYPFLIRKYAYIFLVCKSEELAL